MAHNEANTDNDTVWYLDSGASNHMCRYKHLFKEMQKVKGGYVSFGDASNVKLKGQGMVLLGSIQDVYYVPDLKTNILSMGQLMEKGYSILMRDRIFHLKDKQGHLVTQVEMGRNRMYKLNLRNIREKYLRVDVEDKALQQSLIGKEQMLEDMRGILQAIEEKRHASLAELSSKHQKHIEILEAQIVDSVSDRNKSTETISSLQRLVVEKESKLADINVASTGEVARLRAAIESIKGELIHMKKKHEKEKESWEAASQALNWKMEITEGNCVHTEVEVAKMRNQLELELSVQTQLVNSKEVELVIAKEEINCLESEFASYKVRDHPLLQRKDAKLAATMYYEQLKAQKVALKEAENKILLVSAVKDKALRDLADALNNHNKELRARDAALSSTEQ